MSLAERDRLIGYRDGLAGAPIPPSCSRFYRIGRAVGTVDRLFPSPLMKAP
jgi:hypothetical protein